VLVLALAALAVAGPLCTTLENESFDTANTVAPWLVNAYLGGSDNCPGSTSNNQCELLQQNSVLDPLLLNSGRISVGQSANANCRTNPNEAVGRNVYQQNIGMCRGNTLRATVGYQDDNNEPSVPRVDNTFAIVVGRDHFDLNGGVHTEVVSHSFAPPGAAPYNLLTVTSLEGVWNGLAGDDCSPVCPNDNCFAVGIRYTRDAVVTARVRGYIDDLTISDEVLPVITANDVSAMATSCGASTSVNYDTSATDNCCAVVTIEYSTDGGSTWSTTASGSFTPGTHTVDVRATDNSGNQAFGSFTVRIAEFKPDISCEDFSAETESCFTNLPEQTQIDGLATKVGACASSSAITYSPTLDSEFGNGITVVTATYTQTDELGGTYTLTCDSNVQFTLCCQADDVEAKRSAPATLRKLAKF